MDPSVATTSVTGGLNIETPAGRKSFTVEEYISRCVQEGPSAVISMADETNHNTSKKRTRKAYDTTLSWFHKLASTSAIDWNKCFLFGTVTGMASSDEQYIRIMTEDMIRNGARGTLSFQ